MMTVDEYIAAAPTAAQKHATQIRKIIKNAAPDAQETISYGMPYYSQKGRLIYWAAYQDYIGLYIMNDARSQLADKLKPYRNTRSTLHLSLNEALPEQLITEIVHTQLAANLARHTS